MNKPSNIIYAAGTIHKSNSCGYFEVITYNNWGNIIIKFKSTGYVTTVTGGHIKSGGIRCLLTPSVYGIGYYGVGEYKAKVGNKNTSVYDRWRNMIRRCYNEKDKAYINYGAKGIRVANEWHNFQNYAGWYYSQCGVLTLNPEDNKYQVDKDITSVDGESKIYSSLTCRLVTRQENNEEASAKEWIFINPNGVIVTIYNLKKYCTQHKLNASMMRLVFNSGQKQYKGWTIPCKNLLC
jgi:hypothetical protein